MDAAPCSRATSHGPDGCTCILLQARRLQQGPQYPPRPVSQLTGPLASTVSAFATPYVHFPTSQSGTEVYNAAHDYHNLQQCYKLHDHSVYSSLCPTVSLIHTRICPWNLFNFISPPQMDKLVEIAQLPTLERNAGDFHLTKMEIFENILVSSVLRSGLLPWRLCNRDQDRLVSTPIY
jgi:hypothetical protein